MLRAILLAAATVLAGGGARCEDAAFALGRHGWVLEHYGADVSLLRTGPAGPDEAALLLSCDGRDRRLRLSFTGKNGVPSGFSAGTVLIRAIDRTGRMAASLDARVAAAGERAFLVAAAESRAADDPVLGVARMLEAQPAALDLLLHAGAGPITLRGLVPLRLIPAFGPDDGIAFREFVSACERAGGRPRG